MLCMLRCLQLRSQPKDAGLGFGGPEHSGLSVLGGPVQLLLQQRSAAMAAGAGGGSCTQAGRLGRAWTDMWPCSRQEDSSHSWELANPFKQKISSNAQQGIIN